MADDKNPNVFIIINIILTIILGGLLVLFFIFRAPWMILVILGLVLYFITAFVGVLLKKRFQWKLKLPQSMLRYYLLMAGILLGELTIGLVFFLLADKLPTLFAILSLALFISLIVYIIFSAYREKIKLVDKKEVQDGYKKNGIRIVLILLGVIVLLIIIKSLILLYNAVIF